jgi:digeranylgeranylglycerophospholipid reductase
MSHDFDVIVAGAGPAGCLAARDMARAGLRVGLFDSAVEEKLSKPIVVEIERTIFKEVGIEAPGPVDTPYHAKTTRVFSPKGKETFSIPTEELAPVSVYQDRLVRGLLDSAKKAGARFFPGHLAVRPLFGDGTVAGAIFKMNGLSETHNVTAKVTVDATGFNATLVNRMPSEAGFDFPVGDKHVVVAENRLHGIDHGRAVDAVKSGLHGDDELWTRFGKYGRYSTVFSFLSTEARRAYILIGYRQIYRDVPPISQAIAKFREEQGYYAEELCGGKGLIRIRHSLDRLVWNGFLVIGEAACQVIPVHGSGIASGLHAGRLAAAATVDAVRSGDTSAKSLWPYARDYQRTRGGILAAYDVSRLTIDMMTVEQLGTMLDTGLMSEDDFKGGVIPAAPGLKIGSIPRRLMILASHPGIAPRVVSMGLMTKKILGHYARYPESCDEPAIDAWIGRKRSILDPLSPVL